MKVNSNFGDDGQYHQYCLGCKAETVEKEVSDKLTYYRCLSCGKRFDRSLIVDPNIVWWIDEAREYWHESSGVFIQNSEGRFLFFERTIFPFAVTVPAGHVDEGEDPSVAARRELEEETDIKGHGLKKIGVDDIKGDSCRRGCDAHRWHTYLLKIKTTPEVHIKEEGLAPEWLSLDEALRKDLTFPVRQVITKYRYEFERGTV